MKLIKVEHAYKIYKNGTTAVADLSVSIDKGEFVFVIGSTGSGTVSYTHLILGLELDKMTPRELKKCVNEYNVFARVSPDHKYLIVDALERQGKVVAMTGDGVNDCLLYTSRCV